MELDEYIWDLILRFSRDNHIQTIHKRKYRVLFFINGIIFIYLNDRNTQFSFENPSRHQLKDLVFCFGIS